MMTFKLYKHKETGEEVTIRGFGSQLHPSGKMLTMVWIKNDKKDKAEFIRASDFDNNYEPIN